MTLHININIKTHTLFIFFFKNRYDLLCIMDIVDHDCSLYAIEIAEELVSRGGSSVCASTIRYWLHKIGFSYKKVWRYARRAQLIHEISYWEHFYTQQYHINQLVFFDESSINRRCANRRYGWSNRGDRAVFRYIQHNNLRYSLLAAVDCHGIVDYGIIEGTCNAAKLFHFFVTSLMLAMNAYPAPRSVLILDNASIHHSDPFQRVAGFIGIRLIYLPPYSPHLNIVELFFNCLKRSLEKNRFLTEHFPLVTLIAICEHYRQYNSLGAMEHAGYLRFCRTN